MCYAMGGMPLAFTQKDFLVVEYIYSVEQKLLEVFYIVYIKLTGTKMGEVCSSPEYL